MIGESIGHYRIEAKAGQGGMGVVYRATDTQLNRSAAIKLLRADAVADPDRKKRFIQEAKAASALNHPNIVTIYHIGTEGAMDFIAMEYVPGRPLDAVIHGRPLPPAEALRYAVQIASALAAAHEAGIVHRDLKPGNVMVTDKGQVKLLDFGLAKLTEQTESSESAVTGTMGPQTAAGMVMGTFAYMSPEQAQGMKVDGRSDIYSFGVVLHEMLSGKRPSGAGAVLDTGPRDLRRIVARCLQSDPSQRFQVMDDLRMALEDVDVAVEASVPRAAPRRRILWLTLALLGAAAAAGIAWWLKPDRPASGPILTRITMDSGLTTDPALSNDGRLVAYASDRGEGNLDIWVQQLAGGEAVRLTMDAADDSEPTFSPDGSKIAFRSERDGGGVYVVSAMGGDARRIADQGRRPRWSPNGTQIAYWAGLNSGFLMNKADAQRIYVVPASGGESRRIVPEFAVAWAPVWSADSTHLLFLGHREADAGADWWVTPRDGGPAVETGAHAAIQKYGLTASPESFFLPAYWDAQGQVLFSAQLGDSTNLWQIRIRGNGGTAGTPQRLTAGTGLEVQPSAAVGGRLVFSTVTNSIDLWSLPTDTLSGKATGPMQRLTQDPATDAYPQLSPEGGKLVFASNRSGTYDLWLRDMATGKETVLAAQVIFPSLPIIAKDGSKIIFSMGKPVRWVTLPLLPGGGTRSGAPQMLFEQPAPLWDFSADGKWVVESLNPNNGFAARDLATGKTTEILRADGDIMGRLRISPDDRWIAFTHRSRGEARVIVAPFRPGGHLSREQCVTVSTPETQANIATWSPDSGMVYFISDQDGRFCIWARHIDRSTGHTAGDAFPVWHFHEARRSLTAIPLGLRALALSRDRLIANLSEGTGNIWMATNSPPGLPQAK